MTAAASLTARQATGLRRRARGYSGAACGARDHLSPPETVNTAPRDTAAASSPIRILLVEDDDGDALLVEELLAVSGAHVEIVRAQTLADARREKLDADRLRAAGPRPARRARPGGAAPAQDRPRRTCRCSCSPGFDDERRGVAGGRRRRAGLPGQGPDRRPGPGARGPLRGRAPARRRGAPAARGRARCTPEENARLERGLLPAPLVTDPAAAADRALPPGPPARAAGRRLLRRGAGRRRDRARRDRRRLRPRAGRRRARRLPADRLAHARARRARAGRACCRRCRSSTTHERHFSWMFTTLCMVTIAPDRAAASIRLAGHPPPLLIADGAGSTALEPRAGRPAARRRRRRALDRASSTRCPSAGRCCSTPTG